MITKEAIKQAADRGTALEHLTPGQVWAASSHDTDPELLKAPLCKHMAWILAQWEQDAVIEFFKDVAITDSEEILRRVYDDSRPMFLRSPILEGITGGLEKAFPGLQVGAINQDGAPLYRTADLAKALGVREQDVVEHARKMGMIDCLLFDEPPHRTH
ncbi:hypothetical protein ACT3R7_19995 [Halomonas sp. AOP43-A1-21]